jgi:hypothetical protein
LSPFRSRQASRPRVRRSRSCAHCRGWYPGIDRPGDGGRGAGLAAPFGKNKPARGQAACLGRGAEVAGCRVVVANKPQDAALGFLQQTHPDSKDLLSVSTSKRHRYDQEPPPVDLADIGEPRADAWHRNGSAVQRVAPRKGARLGQADFVDAIARPVAAFVMRSLPCFVAGGVCLCTQSCQSKNRGAGLHHHVHG